MRVESPEPVKVKVIDYDFAYVNGKERQFTLRPDLGDTETITDTHLIFWFGRTQHRAVIYRQHIVEMSRREREIVPYQPTPNDGRSDSRSDSPSAV